MINDVEDYYQPKEVCYLNLLFKIKLPTSAGSSKNEESSRKTSISAVLTMPKPLTVWIIINLWKILKEMGIPDHPTCLLRNLYAGQEATVRTRHGTMAQFKIGKGVCQGCLSPCCLFIRGVHNVKCQAGIMSWNQDWQQKYQ